jgi:hypothetical protein
VRRSGEAYFCHPGEISGCRLLPLTSGSIMIRIRYRTQTIHKVKELRKRTANSRKFLEWRDKFLYSSEAMGTRVKGGLRIAH